MPPSFPVSFTIPAPRSTPATRSSSPFTPPQLPGAPLAAVPEMAVEASAGPGALNRENAAEAARWYLPEATPAQPTVAAAPRTQPSPCGAVSTAAFPAAPLFPVSARSQSTNARASGFSSDPGATARK